MNLLFYFSRITLTVKMMTKRRRMYALCTLEASPLSKELFGIGYAVSLVLPSGSCEFVLLKLVVQNRHTAHPTLWLMATTSHHELVWQEYTALSSSLPNTMTYHHRAKVSVAI